MTVSLVGVLWAGGSAGAASSTEGTGATGCSCGISWGVSSVILKKIVVLVLSTASMAKWCFFSFFLLAAGVGRAME